MEAEQVVPDDVYVFVPFFNREAALTLPKENVIKFILADDTWITVRPSSTEPKCRFYIRVVGETKE